MRNPFEGLIEDRKMPHQGVIAVKIERRPGLSWRFAEWESPRIEAGDLCIQKTHPFLPFKCGVPLTLALSHRGEGGVRGLHSALV